MNPARCQSQDQYRPSIEAFEAGTFAAPDFSHRLHIHVAWGYLRRYDLPDFQGR